MVSPPITQPKYDSHLWSVVRRVFQSRWTFAALQVSDLLTTLAAFHVGAYEVNPLVAHLTFRFGRTGGVVVSKLIALAIAMGVRKRLWVVNMFYVGIVLWNILVVVAMISKR